MVQIHRCPATVSGTKSAETTEAVCLGKVQRVGETPRARRPALHGAETSFRGKGAAACVAVPNHYRLGFFYACCLPSRVGLYAFLPCGGSVEEGKQAVVPPAALPPLSCTCCPLPIRLRDVAASPTADRDRLSISGSEGGERHGLRDCRTLC